MLPLTVICVKPPHPYSNTPPPLSHTHASIPSQFDLPYVQIQRVKEFRFREILRPFGSSANEEAQGSVDNLVQVGV